MGQVYKVGELSWDDGDIPRRWHWREPVAYFFPRYWEKVALRHHLKGQEFRLLLALVSACNWGNKCTTTLAGLGRTVGLSKSTMTRCLRQLVDARLVVVERPHGERAALITLSPALVWKGRPWHLAHARDQFAALWRLHHGGAQAATGAAATRVHLPTSAIPERSSTPRPLRQRRAGPYSAYPPRVGVGSVEK